MSITYTATATREGRWWMVEIPELDGLTQARRLSEAAAMAAEYIAATTDVKLSEVDVELEVERVGTIDVSGRLETIRREREQATVLEKRASAEIRELARELSDAEVPMREIGTILGVSHQRVAQLIGS